MTDDRSCWKYAIFGNFYESVMDQRTDTPSYRIRHFQRFLQKRYGPTDGRTDGRTKDDFKLPKKAKKAKKQNSKKAKDGRTDGWTDGHSAL